MRGIEGERYKELVRDREAKRGIGVEREICRGNRWRKEGRGRRLRNSEGERGKLRFNKRERDRESEGQRERGGLVVS